MTQRFFAAQRGVLPGEPHVDQGVAGQSESYGRIHKALSGKIAKLSEEIERSSAAPEFVDTGRTYWQVWLGMDDEERRVFLQRHKIGVRVTVDPRDSAIRVVKIGMPWATAEGAGLRMPEHSDGSETPTLEYKINARRRRGQGGDGPIDWGALPCLSFP
ncbi:hypothetical protein [Streptomyces sp. H34-S4]|uniref:hypothetical protein n=1 Tax=Streptomyces sp. H34-S4 TaxID=2996463 RepID=UPI0022711A4C|nr:hypothetical protein [Streptomyces sp. H34-S4]MCY0932668.1 hypothetical protein [Streptomyces sp. H34-S4]